MLWNNFSSSQPNSAKIYAESTSYHREKVEKLPLVLIVDDDGDSLFLLGHILSQYACETVVETGGTAALEQIKKLLPDLILLDIWLPEMNGMQITQELKKVEATQSIPIVAVTALASDQDRQRILQAGCDQYISKPYSLEEMESILNGYLRPYAKES
jgi:CheY-like chemotaxis protein